MVNSVDFVIINCVLKKDFSHGGNTVIPECVKDIGPGVFSNNRTAEKQKEAAT